MPPGRFIDGNGDLDFRVVSKMSALPFTFGEYMMIKRYYVDVTMLRCVGTIVGRKLRNEVQFYRLYGGCCFVSDGRFRRRRARQQSMHNA